MKTQEELEHAITAHLLEAEVSWVDEGNYEELRYFLLRLVSAMGEYEEFLDEHRRD